MAKRNNKTLLEELENIGAIGDLDLQSSQAPDVNEGVDVEFDIDDLQERCQKLSESFKALRELATSLEEEAVAITSSVQSLNEALEEDSDEEV